MSQRQQSKRFFSFFLVLFIACPLVVTGQDVDYKQFLSLTYMELDSLFELSIEKEASEKLLPYAQAGLQKSEKDYGKQDSTTAKWLYRVGYAYDYGIEDYDKALEFYNKARSIQKTEKLLLLAYATTILAIGDIYNYILQQYTVAESLYLEVIAIQGKTLGMQHPDFATSLNNLARLHEEMGNYEQALSLYIQSMNIREKALGVQHLDFASSLNDIAFLHESMGNYEQALPLYIQSMNIREKTLGVQHPNFATSLNSLARLHESMGNYEQALPLFIQSMNIRKKALGVQHPDFATSLNSLAGLYVSMGNYEQALPLFIQSMNVYEKALGVEHPYFATSLNNLAGLHESMGNYEQALPLYIQSMNIYEKTLGVQHPLFATSLNNLAFLYESMGNYEQALLFYIKSMNTREKALGVQHPDFASSLNNLAHLHEKMGNYEQALPLYIQSMNIWGKALGVQHPDFASSLNNLALLHESMRNYEQALPLYIQSMNIREKALGVQHTDFAISLNNLAHLYKKMRNYEQALEYLLQAIEVSSTLNLSSNITQAWADSLLIAPYASNPHLEGMIESLEQFYALLQEDANILDAKNKTLIITDLTLLLLTKLRNNVSNEQDKLRLLEQSNDWLKKSLHLLDNKKQANKAFQLADQNKSVLLLQATKSEQAYRLGELPDSLVFEDKKLLKKQSQLEAKLLEKRSDQEKDSLRNELNHVNKELGVFANKIKKEFPKYYHLKYQHIDAKVEEIQALLDEKTALLEYVVADSMLHLFYVDKKEVRWVQNVLVNSTLSKKTKDLHSVLSDYTLLIKKENESYQKYTGLAHWFYQNLIQPMQIDAKTIQNLIIVSDGELGHLPFEAFLVETAPQSLTEYKKLHYLVSDFNISYNYSATLWKENVETPTPQNNGQMLAFAANYELKLDNYRDSSNSVLINIRLPSDQWMRESLKPLPAARKEVEALQEKFNGFFAFDNNANEKLLKEKAPDYAIIHLAMHGLLDSKRPVLSSLACTEDNDSTENNFWQAHEISKIQLNANLVVLSACETGYGKFEQGNGIASLARAFMYAGSSALIVSLWQVNDYATSELMKNLYNNLADGMKKDEALRQAKLQYMATTKGILAHPAFWSPFIMMGNTEVMVVSRKGNMWGWGIGIGVLALVGIGGLVLKKKE